MYGKLIDGKLVYSGQVLYTETEQVFNATEELWLAHGWKRVIYDECFSDTTMPVITETKTEIRVSWVE